MPRKEMERTVTSFIYDITVIKLEGETPITEKVSITSYKKLSEKQVKERVEDENTKVFKYDFIEDERKYKMDVETFIEHASIVE